MAIEHSIGKHPNRAVSEMGVPDQLVNTGDSSRGKSALRRASMEPRQDASVRNEYSFQDDPNPMAQVLSDIQSKLDSHSMDPKQVKGQTEKEQVSCCNEVLQVEQARPKAYRINAIIMWQSPLVNIPIQ